VECVRLNLDFFQTRPLVAAGNTGGMLQSQRGLTVERAAQGPWDGDLIIGGRVAEARIEAVLLFRDPFDRSAT
jgi:methylglyoxal synthase